MPARISATWKTPNARAAPVQFSGHVHQAAEIAAKQQIGVGRFDIAGFFIDDGVGDGRVFDAECSAEAAAGLAIRQRRQRKARDLGEKRARLALNAKFAQSRAAVVIGRARGKRDSLRTKAEDIDEEAGQLIAFRGERFGAAQPSRIIGEKLRVMQLDHAHAGA